MELGTQLDKWLSPLFWSARAFIEEEGPSLDKIVDTVRRSLDRLRWKMIDEVDFYVVEIREEYVLVVRCVESECLFYRVPYSFDESTGDVEFGEWEQIVQVSEYRTLDGEPLEEVVNRINEELGWPNTDELLEGWLPAGTSQNDLDDGDFAWLSNAYKKASKAEKAKMNKREHRKLPYKIHGKVNREGWKAAWKAVVGGGARGLKSYAGGSSKKDVINKLRGDKPKGIKINKDNTFVDQSNTEETRPMAPGDRTLLLTVEDTPVIEETGVDDKDNRPYLIYVGTALVDNAVSGNNKFYDAESNDRIMLATNQYLQEGGISTVYSRHGKAVPGPLGELPTGLPVGKLIPPLWRDSDRIRYKARISGTSEGQDVMVLVEDGVMKFTSIRSRPGGFKLVRKKVNGREVEAVVDAIIHGIDLADAPGIEGAGIDEVLTEELVIEDLSTKEEDPMELKDLTLELLRKERPDLVEELLKGQQLAEEAKSLGLQVTDLKGKVEAAEAALAQAKTEHDEAIKALTEEKDAKIAELTEEVNEGKVASAITKAVEGKEHVGHLRRALTYGFVLVEEKDGQVTETQVEAPATEEEVAERLPQAEAYVKSLTEEFGGKPDKKRDSFKGSLNTQAPAGDDAQEDEDTGGGALTEEEMDEVIRLSAG